jgi:hypothetical protein
MIVTEEGPLPPIVLTPDGGLKPLILTGERWPFGGAAPPDDLTPAGGWKRPRIACLNVTVLVQCPPVQSITWQWSR